MEISSSSIRQLFLKHVGQTSEAPLALNIVKAEGSKIWDAEGNEFVDLIGGISVCNVGHRHPKVIEAIKNQLDHYLHIMVYGELIENPQVHFAKKITEYLPENLNNVFFTASGSEATEAAMKLAKRATGRTQIIAFENSYHGSTQGSLSLMGSEYWRNAYRPLLPDVLHLRYNNFDDLNFISNKTAAVFAETIQSESGVTVPDEKWLKALRQKCSDTNSILVLDEIQCGFGRNGSLWSFEQFGIVPDMLLLGKALGGGMPLGALIADKKLMDNFSTNPVLGHMNTFGGHPVSCAAGLAAMNALIDEKMIENVNQKAELFHSLLNHPKIEKLNYRGLMIAIHFDSFETNKKIIDQVVEQGVFTDWFLFAPNALRIVPPLNISEDEIKKASQVILNVLNNL